MVLPKIFTHEHDLYAEFEDALDELNVSKKLVTVCGKGPTKKITQGYIENVKKYELLGPIEVSKATAHAANKVTSIAKKYNAPVVGIGGGSKLDVAKKGGSDARKDVILVPTQPTHDGMASNVVSINEWGKLYSYPVDPPLAVFLQMPVLYKAPLGATRRGVGDSNAKLTANLDWRLSAELKSEKQKDPPYNENIYRLCIDSTMKVIDNVREMKEGGKFGKRNPLYKQFVSNLVDALISYGINMCILESSVCASGTEHSIGHALDGMASNPPPHGIGVGGIGLITSLMLYETFNPEFAREHLPPTIDSEAIKELNDYLGIRYQTRRLRIKKSEAIAALPKAVEIEDERGRVTNLDYIRFYREPKVEINEEFAREYLGKFGII